MEVVLDIPPALVARLTQVRNTGLYGRSFEQAIERLVSERILDLIRDEILDKDTNTGPWNANQKPGRV